MVVLRWLSRHVQLTDISQAKSCMRFSQNIIKHTNQGVFDIYTPEMKKARHNKIITGLPDTYGRGRIVGDYRRVALYGVDFLIEKKQYDFERYARHGMKGTDFRLREELADQIKALKEMKEMAAAYGFDIQSRQRCKRSSTVAVFRIPCSNQDSERSCNECRTYLYIP